MFHMQRAYAYRDKHSVACSAVFIDPLTEAADSDACSFPDRCIIILEGGVNDRPNFRHARSHKLAAALDSDAQGQDGSAAMRRVA
jgi:hypothetical protein